MRTERCARNATSDTQPGILLWCPVGDHCLAVVLGLDQKKMKVAVVIWHTRNQTEFRGIPRNSADAKAPSVRVAPEKSGPILVSLWVYGQFLVTLNRPIVARHDTGKAALVGDRLSI